MRRLALILTPILMLVGCAQPTTVPVPTQSVTPQVPVPTTSAAPIVVYNKSGCIQGLNDTLTVFGNGSLELVDRLGNKKTAVGDPATIKTLRLLLSQAQFSQLDAKYSASGADLCNYRITDLVGGKTVETMDAANYPEILHRVIVELDRLRSLVQ